jgi:hypothetical protein
MMTKEELEAVLKAFEKRIMQQVAYQLLKAKAKK